MKGFSGKVGSEKCHVITSILGFLRIFCNKCDIYFDSDIVKATDYTGLANAQFIIPYATTIRGTANLNFKSQRDRALIG